MDEKVESELWRYLIQIEGPANFGESHIYDTNDYGSGYVRVYRTVEGSTPHINTDVRHIVLIGGFELKQNPEKTPEEFMKEIKDGLAKIVSSD